MDRNIRELRSYVLSQVSDYGGGVDDGTVRTRVPSKRCKDPGNPNGFTSSRRITCCRILKAQFCPRWPGWAQGGVLNGRGSPGWASRSTLWSPAAQKELLTHCEPGHICKACTGEAARPWRRNDRFNGSPRWPFLPGVARIALGSIHQRFSAAANLH